MFLKTKTWYRFPLRDRTNQKRSNNPPHAQHEDRTVYGRKELWSASHPNISDLLHHPSPPGKSHHCHHPPVTSSTWIRPFPKATVTNLSQHKLHFSTCHLLSSALADPNPSGLGTCYQYLHLTQAELEQPPWEPYKMLFSRDKEPEYLTCLWINTFVKTI